MNKYLFGFLLAPTLTFAASNNPNFIVKPQQCVALEQGQECFIDVSVNWQVSDEGNFCLFANETRLHCWQRNNRGQWKSELVMTDDVVMSLKNSSDKVIFSDKVKYAWIYKKRKSKAVRWRMF
ncbi:MULTISPECIES: DUF3019 domain-containing protein [Pseudoalteromonas]|uniref:DUF3019 domain-containing protein n=1 Tax=Pseudoalteromonas luteoviolacea (strain 2ta16) TaxID=1353533 RepID=V4JBL8_PSEL2|nr:DUF3019 domain-containing protein [Pseudoalteromonas luteoviolacea]ESP92517.1 protein of unknown function (DUF3019) [Pseudoalteromonas luteoviolacea 2ta16]KZN35078.1 hypothetical protein N483_24355 [Pseudoalteromonas luteoviolacea NCIMB 1944]MCG7550638.1 DUF3019 domain-containing protein [Pseudoalteromonas sp. Of7M-16]